MEQKFCQSCGMPLSDATVLGTETNGSKNEEYCCYCYVDGHFTVDCTMDEMIDHCAQFVDEFNKDSERRGCCQHEAVLPSIETLEKSLSIPDKTRYIRYSYIAGCTFCVVH